MSMTVHLDDHGLMVQRDFLRSRIIRLFLESALWGVFAVLYSVGADGLLSRDQPRALAKRNRLLVFANTTMFLLATAHLILTVYTTIYGFVDQGDSRQSIEDAFFVVFQDPIRAIEVAQYYIYITQTLIADAFMVYRLFIVWDGRRAIIAAPTIMFVLDALVGYANWPGSYHVCMATVFYAASFFTNMLATSLIMYRVLRSAHRVQAQWQLHNRAQFNLLNYRRVAEALIQSAAMYSIASVSLFVTILVTPNIGYPACLAAFSPYIGVVFSLIVIQIARNSAVKSPPGNNVLLADWRDIPSIQPSTHTSSLTAVNDAGTGNPTDKGMVGHPNKGPCFKLPQLP
ncbi:hypothetical protein C8Q76DRAFT_660916 [Earliella scabrosa]|nr:hypothetical protein C8Q76DRAFT_660916 [Earliella scabrosa]